MLPLMRDLYDVHQKQVIHRDIKPANIMIVRDEISGKERLVLLDFGGRIDFAWDVTFTREYVGDTPTEMFKHFFQSLCTASKCNLRIEAKGENNHHIAEAVFKAYARALRMAIKRDVFNYELPSSKGLL